MHHTFPSTFSEKQNPVYVLFHVLPVLIYKNDAIPYSPESFNSVFSRLLLLCLQILSPRVPYLVLIVLSVLSLKLINLGS